MARAEEDIKLLEDLLVKLQQTYAWNVTKSFAKMTMQKCADMFVYVCKLYD